MGSIFISLDSSKFMNISQVNLANLPINDVKFVETPMYSFHFILTSIDHIVIRNMIHPKY